MIISFKVSKADAALIQRIVERADVRDPLSLAMDITATHANGCPLRLADLLAADPLNFWHDVSGIMRHIDRKTGQLLDCFLPRYSAPKPASAGPSKTPAGSIAVGDDDTHRQR